MKARPEDVPDSASIQELVSGVVQPTLETVGRDAGRCLQMDVVVMKGISEIDRLEVLSAGDEQLPLLHGSVRLRFRAAFGGRWLMHCEALFERADAVKNCSGFVLKAELKDGAAKRTAWTMRYSVWNWTGWT